MATPERTMPPQAVLLALRTAILRVNGKPPLELSTAIAFAFIESSFNPEAQSSASSAKGLFQFTDDTWSEMLRLYGNLYDVSDAGPLDLRANALMGVLRLRRYREYLKSLKLPYTPGDMYCLHFLGMTGGTKLINDTKIAPIAAMKASDVFVSAGMANMSLFGNRTIAQLYAELRDKVNPLARDYEILYSPIQGV